MKKTLLILSIFLLIGCGRDIPTTNLIVKKIVIEGGINCKYIGDGTWGAPFSSRAAIIDTCGKWNIGDTIKFIK